MTDDLRQALEILAAGWEKRARETGAEGGPVEWGRSSGLESAAADVRTLLAALAAQAEAGADDGIEVLYQGPTPQRADWVIWREDGYISEASAEQFRSWRAERRRASAQASAGGEGGA